MTTETIPPRRASMKEGNVMLLLACFLLLFYGLTFASHHYKWDAVIIGVFRELLTIPTLALLIVLPVYNLVRYFRSNAVNKSPYVISFLIEAAIIAVIVWATVMG